MTLELRGVGKSFDGTRVLSNVDLRVPTGDRLALVGASGNGKTTLLRLIAGFERPDTGTIRLDSNTLDDETRHVPSHRRGIGYMAQDGALFPHLTVAGNIGFGVRRSKRRTRVAELMELVSLAPALASRFPHELSGGQQQRVALARALARRPAVMLLDEPFSSLDTGLRESTRRAISQVLERAGVTTILVTHDQHEALDFGAHLGIVADGSLAQLGSPADVFDAPASPEIAAFVGEAITVPARRKPEGVACAFGRQPIRKDLSAGAGEVAAMIRPAQLTVERITGGEPIGERSAEGRVIGVSRSGALAVVHVQVVDPWGSLVLFHHRVAPHRAAEFATGDQVRVVVADGVVLYAARDAFPAN